MRVKQIHHQTRFEKNRVKDKSIYALEQLRKEIKKLAFRIEGSAWLSVIPTKLERVSFHDDPSTKKIEEIRDKIKTIKDIEKKELFRVKFTSLLKKLKKTYFTQLVKEKEILKEEVQNKIEHNSKYKDTLKSFKHYINTPLKIDHKVIEIITNVTEKEIELIIDNFSTIQDEDEKPLSEQDKEAIHDLFLWRNDIITDKMEHMENKVLNINGLLDFSVIDALIEGAHPPKKIN